jgi:hypothetical protein
VPKTSAWALQIGRCQWRRNRASPAIYVLSPSRQPYQNKQCLRNHSVHTCLLRAIPRAFSKSQMSRTTGCCSNKQVHSQYCNRQDLLAPIISICIYVSYPELVASQDGNWTGISHALGFLVIYPPKKSSKPPYAFKNIAVEFGRNPSNLYLLIETLALRHHIQVHHLNTTIPNTSTKV